ncbi:putative rhamnosyl transferase [Sulfitobacter delicatus]|uniref:Putative rhamnosyl transferase n=1 Tax=Sulfitobacter delicatus TaxID=218672 RepID=A0A1G7HAS0_9RHOB|nr:putative rhamnosyl transferase [Sulfitobacter delicatus]SDE97476.1 Putative rhamnosyl transferase [Sulfitobacter delicatus]
MQAIGLCRFSYPALGGFQVGHETTEERIAYLYDEARLEERFRLLETVALPCLEAQTDPDFGIVFVIGDQFPQQHEKRLESLLADLPQAVIHREPPRRHREVMKEVLNDARIHPNEPCLQFRYDDDDAVSVDFIARLRRAVENSAGLLKGERSVAFDWPKGYVAEFDASGIRAAEVFRPLNVAALAMYVKGGSPLTIMNFAHEKLPRFMPTVSLPDAAMFVRSHNGSNDSRQGVAQQVKVAPLDAEGAALFRDRFAIDEDHVRQVFSA